jgi:hypothetical protein
VLRARQIARRAGAQKRYAGEEIDATKKRLPEGWLLSTSGSAPRLRSRFTQLLGRSEASNADDYNSVVNPCQS